MSVLSTLHHLVYLFLHFVNRVKHVYSATSVVRCDFEEPTVVPIVTSFVQVISQKALVMLLVEVRILDFVEYGVEVGHSIVHGFSMSEFLEDLAVFGQLLIIVSHALANDEGKRYVIEHIDSCIFTIFDQVDEQVILGCQHPVVRKVVDQLSLSVLTDQLEFDAPGHLSPFEVKHFGES